MAFDILHGQYVDSSVLYVALQLVFGKAVRSIRKTSVWYGGIFRVFLDWNSVFQRSSRTSF